MPTIPPNNTSGLYGIDNGNVAVNNELNVENIYAQGNIGAGGTISAQGNITTDGYFVGNFAGNISGNLVVPGSNTQVLYNNNGNAGASAGLTFNSASNVLAVTGDITTSANVSGNYILGNGSLLTGLSGTQSQILNGTSNVKIGTANGNVSISVAGTPNVMVVSSNTANITGSLGATANIVGGNLITAGRMAATGNVTGGNLVTTGRVAATGNVSGGNITTAGKVDATGNITTSGYFIGTFLGNISGNLVVPGSNTQVIYNNNGNAGASTGFTFDSASNVANIAGNIISGGYFIGNGSQLTGLPASYSNTDVSNYLASGSDTANIITTGNISGTYILGNAAFMTGIPAQYGNSNVATYLPTYTGNLNPSNLSVSTSATFNNHVLANVADPVSAQDAATKNYVDGQLSSNGFDITDGVTTQTVNPGDTITLSGVTNETTVTVSAPDTITIGLPDNVTVTGNLTAANLIGSGQYITNIPGGNVTGNVANAVHAYFADVANSVSGSNVSGQVANALVAGTVYTAAQPNITSVGTLTSLAVTGNITGGNVTTGGNVQGSYIIGNGSALTSLTGANVTGTVANATHATVADSANSVAGGNVTGQVANALVAGTVYTAAQPNITSVGTLSSLAVTGNVTAGNVSGTLLTGTLTTAAQPNVTSVGTLTSLAVTGNVTGGNLSGTLVTGTLTTAAQPNITSVGTLSSLAVSGNVTAGNVAGTLLTGTLTTAAQPNITSVGTLSSLAVTGNVTGGNLTTAGTAVVGNLTLSGDTIVGSGPTLTIDPNGAGSNTGNVVIAGNLTVTGNVTSISSNIVTINDKFINLANNASTQAEADGSGIGVGPLASEYASFTYNSTGNVWNISNGANVFGALNATGNVTGGNVTTSGVSQAGTLSVTGAGTIGTTLGVTGNITGGNVSTTGKGNIGTLEVTGTGTVTGNLSGGNISTAGQVSATGNITGGNVITAGSTSTGTLGVTTSATIGTTLGVTGNITGGNVTTAGSTSTGTLGVTGAATVGTTLGVTGNITGGNVTTAGKANIGTLEVTGTGSVTGNLSGGNLTTAGQVVATGNVTGGNLVTAGTTTTGTLGVNGAATVGTTLGVTGNITGGNVTTAGKANIGTLEVTGTTVVTGNITGGNLTTAGQVVATGNITGGNVITSGTTSTATLGVSGAATVGTTLGVTGNITGGNLITSGTTSTGSLSASGAATVGTTLGVTGNITGGNVSATRGVFTNIVGTLETAAQPNITSVGTLTSLTVSGNITGGNLATAGTLTAATASINGNLAANNVTAASSITATSGNVTAGGNLVAGSLKGVYIGTASIINTNGTPATLGVTADSVGFSGSLTTVGNITSSGNVQGTSLLTDGPAGNIYGANYIFANNTVVSNTFTVGAVTYSKVDGVSGQVLATYGNGITYWTNNGSGGSYGNADVSAYLASGTDTANIITTANVTGGNLTTAGRVVATGNVSGGNLVATTAMYAGNCIIRDNPADGYAYLTTANSSLGVSVVAGDGTTVVSAHPTYGPLLMTNYGTTFEAVGWKNGNLTFNPFGLGSTGNILSVNRISAVGNITTTANVTGGNVTSSGILRSSQSAANEGGEIQLAIPSSGTTLTGNVIIDSYQDKIRFFINDGTTYKGAYIDLTAAANTVGSNLLAGGGSTYGDSNVNTLLASWGSNTLSTTGNVTVGNMIMSGQIYDTSGVLQLNGSGNVVLVPVGSTQIYGNTNIIGGKLTIDAVTYTNVDGTAGQVLTTYGNGQTYWTTGGGGSYGDSNVTTLLASLGSNVISSTANITTTGNIAGGNIKFGANGLITTASGDFSVFTTANTSGGAYTASGDQTILVGAHPSLGVLFGTNWGTTFNAVTWNGGNLNLNGLGSGAGGNIINLNNMTIGNNITSVATWDPNSASNTAPANGRILIGSGYNGNTSYQYDVNGGARGGRLVVLDSGSMGDTQQRLVGTYTQIAATATANITNSNTRFQGGQTNIVFGGGAAGNTINTNNLAAVAGHTGTAIVGTSGNLAVGNTQVGHATGVAGYVLPQTGSTVGNAVGVLGQVLTQGTSNVTNSIGVFAAVAPNTTGNAIAFYQPGTTNNYGISIGSGSNTRALNNYYFVKTDDPSAKSDLGALNVYNEVAYATGGPSTAGVLNVNRLNGGCQYMILSENITNMSLSNFQSVFSIGSKTQYAFDTVTLLINANGYSLSLPATLSSAEAAKYANGTAVGPASTGNYFIVLTNTPLGVYITISPVFS